MVTVKFEFRVKEIGIRRRHVVVVDVQVPDNWREMDKEEFREYMTREDKNLGRGYFTGKNAWTPSPTPLAHFVFKAAAKTDVIIDGDISYFSWKEIIN